MEPTLLNRFPFGLLLLGTIVLAIGGQERTTSAPEPFRFPIRIVKDVVLVDVRVNDTGRLTFILDTGFGQDVIDRNTARRLRLELHDIGFKIQGPGPESPDILVASGVRTSLSESVGWRGTLQALPLGHLEKPLGERVHGVLGAPIFRNYVVDIDYREAMLRLWKPAEYSPPDDATRLPIAIRGERPRITVQLASADGRRRGATLLLDTGANVGVALSSSYEGWPAAETEETRKTAQGIGGGFEFRSGGKAQVEWGGLRITDVDVSLGYPAHERGLDGLLGGHALRGLRLVLDYASEQVYVW